MMFRYLRVLCPTGKQVDQAQACYSDSSVHIAHICFDSNINVKVYLRETLVRRPEFCLVVNRLRRSCRGHKVEGLNRYYPGLCDKYTDLPHT